ncbi:PAS domain-containing protein [Undibacterium arcticum]|uniref:PAS domain-containing protein n=1 Tax=Undibacterium arcticum TaxID=1762892 RepID=UPI003605DA88
MKRNFLPFKDIITGVEIFRLVSPIFYVTLLLQLAMSSYGQLPVLSDTSSIAGICLMFLFFATLARFFRFKAVAIGRGQVLLEFVVANLIITVLTLQRTVPALPWPWLVAMAALFPLVVEGWLAVAPLTALALIGCGLSLAIGMPLGDWLPSLFQILFIGMLSILLSRVLLINVSAIRHARTNSARFEAIVHVTQHVFLMTDDHYTPMFISPAIQDMLGYTVDEITQAHVQPKVHPDDLKEHQEKLRFLAQTPNSSIFICHRMQHKNGTWLWLETRGYNMMHDPAIHGLVFGTKDVTLRRTAELKLEQERALLHAVLDHNPAMIYAKDTDGRFTISNVGFQRRFGFSSEDEVRGKTVYEVLLNRVLEGQEAKAHEVAEKSTSRTPL